MCENKGFSAILMPDKNEISEFAQYLKSIRPTFVIDKDLESFIKK